MKVLLVLILSFALSLGISKSVIGEAAFELSGNLAMMVMLCFSAMGHFKFTNGMVMMMPGFIPQKQFLVYFTGVLEIVLGIALLFSATRSYAGQVLLLLFLLMLPANIYAAIRHVDFEKATLDGKGPGYLWFRIPLQFFFICWVILFSIGLKLGC